MYMINKAWANPWVWCKPRNIGSMSCGNSEVGGRCMFVDCFWLFMLRVSSAWNSILTGVRSWKVCVESDLWLWADRRMRLTTWPTQTRTASTALLLDAASLIRCRNLIPQSSWSRIKPREILNDHAYPSHRSVIGIIRCPTLASAWLTPQGQDERSGVPVLDARWQGRTHYSV